jgi:DNA-binding winged helix-turn-helix (wHTH) protein
MKPGNFNFLGFSLDPIDRQLRRGDEPVELYARYFDALTLLVSEAGMLVSKDRFLADIWRGVPVTDEALTQCIKTLRRQLGDQVAVPRFIETVPKHGYRFIAPVTVAGEVPGATSSVSPKTGQWRQVALLGTAGSIGGAAAGLFGGLLYGFATAAPPSAPGLGEASSLLVLICLTTLAGLIGGAGVSFGIAATQWSPSRSFYWPVLGGAVGGLLIGALARLVGLDSFNLLLGRSPGDITGGAEGALLGAAVGLGEWLRRRLGERRSIERGIVPAALLGGGAGLAIPLLGGEMMGGSLDSLARQFPTSRLRLDQIGHMFGESSFGPTSQLVSGAIEGALFAAGIVAACAIAGRHLAPARGSPTDPI